VEASTLTVLALTSDAAAAAQEPDTGDERQAELTEREHGLLVSMGFSLYYYFSCLRVYSALTPLRLLRNVHQSLAGDI
jgi:hypothetical protein